ncbi:type VI secretion protein [Herbaspirillum rubrisubalbicans M1]|nr:type VI secretion protein [Herbaspirillum rubrisubalbicans M1]
MNSAMNSSSLSAPAPSRLPDAVQWSEGMLLGPQHMQQNDIYWQEHLRHRLACIAPHFWGVRHLAVQLVRDTIVVSELECVLPNGVTLCHPGNFIRQPDPLLQLDVSACRAGEPPMRLWLMVPERSQAAARQTDPGRRYDSQVGLMTADENTGDGDIPVGRLQLRYELVLSRTNPAPGQGACPLLEVTRDAQGLLRIDDYLPPMTCLSASSHLGTASLLSQLNARHERWWSQAQQLANEASGYGLDGKLNSAGLRNQMVARHLGGALPSLSALLHAASHPERLYQCLAEVVGHVAQFATSPLPLKMSPYQHDDCLAQFRAALRYIDETLAAEMDRVQQDRLRAPRAEYEVIAFQAQEHGGFSCKLPPQIDNDLIIEIKPRDGQSSADVGRWLKQADIAGISLIPQLQRQRVPGARVRPLDKDEVTRQQLPALADLFVVENRVVDLADTGRSKLFAAEQSLFIQGHAGPHTPAAIFLYQKVSEGSDTV